MNLLHLNNFSQKYARRAYFSRGACILGELGYRSPKGLSLI